MKNPDRRQASSGFEQKTPSLNLNSNSISSNKTDLHRVSPQLVALTEEHTKQVQINGKEHNFLHPTLQGCDVRDGTSNTQALTELGNARRLHDGTEDRLKFVCDVQKWLVWNGSSWQWDDTGSYVRSLAAGLPLIIYAEGVGHPLNSASHFVAWARKSQERRIITASMLLLSDFSQVRIPMSIIDADPFVVGYDQARQIINLRTGTTRAAMPGDFITKSLEPEVIGDAAKALRWVEFLEEIFNGDLRLINWIQRFCGYLLTGSTVEQIFLFCHGFGANGKSVFSEVLKYIMADYCRAVSAETLSDSKRHGAAASPDLVRLVGVRLAISTETEDGTPLAEVLIKGMVSGDSLSARQLYSACIEFNPCFKLIISGNNKPIVRGNDHGIWRRTRLIPFDRTFLPEERDPNLIDRLKSEGPHILAWMLAGCIAWQKQGLADTPEVVRKATSAYEKDQDIVGRWLEECTEKSTDGETSSVSLYASYKNWCMDNGTKQASSVTLGRRLSERGYSVRQSNGKRFWHGLVLTGSSCNANSREYIHATDGD